MKSSANNSIVSKGGKKNAKGIVHKYTGREGKDAIITLLHQSTATLRNWYPKASFLWCTGHKLVCSNTVQDQKSCIVYENSEGRPTTRSVGEVESKT